MSTTTAGTPLTRYGRRVTATATATAQPATTARPSPAVPAPTIRLMIVCVPDELPRQVLDRRLLERHLGVPATITQRFWARPGTRLRLRHLVDPRSGTPTPCAGGPLRLLDLPALRQAHRIAAAMRHHTWGQVVRGTRDAHPWVSYLQRHLDDPHSYPYPQAEADFSNQPRVLAMRAHNALTHGTGRLDEQDLEMLQAGAVAYQSYQYLTAAAGDALLTPDGQRICPTTDRFAHRLAYLQQANHYLDTTDDNTCIVAVALPT